MEASCVGETTDGPGFTRPVGAIFLLVQRCNTRERLWPGLRSACRGHLSVATASDDQPDFGKITVTNVDSSPFVTKINDLTNSRDIVTVQRRVQPTGYANDVDARG
jgi:hypothetical protein